MPVTEFSGDITLIPPEGAYIVHSVSTTGVWGAGVALVLKQAYPKSYASYAKLCGEQRSDLLGRCAIFPAEQSKIDGKIRKIVCLFTTTNVKQKAQNEEGIIVNTELSLEAFNLLLTTQVIENPVIYFPKINSGLFNVEWYITLSQIDRNLGKRNVKILVYTPTPEEDQ